MNAADTAPATPHAPRHGTLEAWLAYCERLHPVVIDMGLARVKAVAERMGLRFACPVITVAGTNGKGSTCAMLESILSQAGYKTGVSTSPHLVRFEERLRLKNEAVEASQLVAAFERVQACRLAPGEAISLTYFEFTTLAILDVMSHSQLDVAILEVGLGGRLDAVNIVDADCAIITSIDLDHTELLGNTREAIGFEKAGIMRAGRPVVVSDPMPPASLAAHAAAVGAHLWQAGSDFSTSGDKQQWTWAGRAPSVGGVIHKEASVGVQISAGPPQGNLTPSGGSAAHEVASVGAQPLRRYSGLAYPALRGANQLVNASGVLAALTALRERLPVTAQAVRNGFAFVELPGRFQIVPGQPALVLDVAHNPHAVAALAANLDAMGYYPSTHAVFGAMADKDLDAMLARISPLVDRWYVTDLPTARAETSQALQTRLQAVRATLDAKKSNAGGVARAAPVLRFDTPVLALQAALAAADPADRIVVFGSFYTVGGVLQAGLPALTSKHR